MLKRVLRRSVNCRGSASRICWARRFDGRALKLRRLSEAEPTAGLIYYFGATGMLPEFNANDGTERQWACGRCGNCMGFYTIVERAQQSWLRLLPLRRM